MKKFLFAVVMLMTFMVTGCDRAADVASRNLSQAGDNFELYRAIHFINTRSDKEIMRVEGLCAKDNSSTDRTLVITCREPNGLFKKHYMGLSTDVTYTIEQLESAPASVDHSRVIFAPQTLIPTVEIR